MKPTNLLIKETPFSAELGSTCQYLILITLIIKAHEPQVKNLLNQFPKRKRKIILIHVYSCTKYDQYGSELQVLYLKSKLSIHLTTGRCCICNKVDLVPFGQQIDDSLLDTNVGLNFRRKREYINVFICSNMNID